MALNSRLQEQVEDIRGIYQQQAEKHPLPERYTATNVPNKPRMLIRDSQTGTSVEVGLFGYSEVRKALSALCSDNC